MNKPDTKKQKKIYLVNVTNDDWFNKMTEYDRYQSVENLFTYYREKKKEPNND